MRVATYNIRNVRALDRASFWWLRRRRLAAVIESIDADVWAMQEVYRTQVRWLARSTLKRPEWDIAGTGRTRRGRGESVPIWHRTPGLRRISSSTRWFSDTPDVAGSIQPGARFPRIATEAVFESAEWSGPLRIVNLHLDHQSSKRRAASLEQLAGWLDLATMAAPTIILGDFNETLDDPGPALLRSFGLRSALGAAAGPTSNGFGERPEAQQQIDHVFVGPGISVERAEIHTAAGFASDHYPVVVDLAVGSSAARNDSPSSR